MWATKKQLRRDAELLKAENDALKEENEALSTEIRELKTELSTARLKSRLADSNRAFQQQQYFESPCVVSDLFTHFVTPMECKRNP